MLVKIKHKILNSIKNINDAYEFKPLLSEIEDSPVSPLGRFMFWTVTALIIITLSWMILGKIDIVVNARAIVLPDGESKIIQPLETGVVKDIFVKEGDFVKKDQLLIELDTSATDAQLKTVSNNLKQSKIEAMRLKSSSMGYSFDENISDEQTREQLQTQQTLYRENLTSLNSAIKAKQQQINQLNNQINTVLAQKKDYEFQLKNAIDRESHLKNVIDIIAYDDYQQAQIKTSSLRQSVFQANFEIARLKAQQSQIRNEINQTRADFKVQNLNVLANTQKQINELEANKEQIIFSNQNQKITAPCDGYIDKLMIHTLGGIVVPAQELIALTPIDKPLVVKAQVANKDIGFIKNGMSASMKIDTFDFQKYGILKGTVKSISKNSIKDEKLGDIYEVYIAPTQDSLNIEGKKQKISTGMTLNVEIEIGNRRIIEFFIYPLIKYLDESINVR